MSLLLPLVCVVALRFQLNHAQDVSSLQQEIQMLRQEIAAMRSPPSGSQASFQGQASAGLAGVRDELRELQQQLGSLGGNIGMTRGGGGMPSGSATNSGLGALGALGSLGVDAAGSLGGIGNGNLGGGLSGLGSLGALGALGSLGGLGGGSSGSAAGGLSGLNALGSLGGLGVQQGGFGTPASSSEDQCLGMRLFATLHRSLQKLTIMEDDPVAASYEIHEAWQNNPSLFDSCPVGVITALVYLSIAQEKDWKFKLLHRATFLQFSTPGLAKKMAMSRWPMSDRLIRTMYYNTETMGKQQLQFNDPIALPKSRTDLNSRDPGVDEAIGLTLENRNRVTVPFGKVLFYHFYLDDKSLCACRTKSWCLPQWTRHLTNESVDVWLAARDEDKTLYRMDRSGCFQSLGVGLATHHFADSFDLVFVFEINAFMHPRCRVIDADRILLYPTYDLSQVQMENFEDLGVSVLPDHETMKPPNPAFRKILEEARTDRQQRLKKPKDRLLLFPADIRPLKGQAAFLEGLLLRGREPGSLRRLKGFTIVVAGSCDGNSTYCEEVVELAEQANAEGIVNVIIADRLLENEMASLYAAALGVVLFSHVDCNPRAVYEGFVTNTPFFVTEATRLPALVGHLGHTIDGDPSAFPGQLSDFVQFAESGGFQERPLEFAKRHLREEDVYRRLVEWMARKYSEGSRVGKAMKTQDALSGAFGGVGKMLGAGLDMSKLGQLIGELGQQGPPQASSNQMGHSAPDMMGGLPPYSGSIGRAPP